MLRQKISAYPASETTPSWMRAPPESLRPTTGQPVSHRQVHHLADLLRVGAREAAAEDGEVLREDEDLAPFDQAVAGDHAVAEELLLVHPEVVAAVGLELVELDERAGVEQQLDALARGQLAVGVLLVDAIGAAAELGARVERGEALAGREMLFRHGAGKLLRDRARGKRPGKGELERTGQRRARRVSQRRGARLQRDRAGAGEDLPRAA